MHLVNLKIYNMFTENDLKQLADKGISIENVEKQINAFISGFPFLDIIKPAIIKDGLIKMTEEECSSFISKYNENVSNLSVIKFVPASGAASRMFKDLYEYVNNSNALSIGTLDDLQKNNLKFIHQFFIHLEKFAFYEELMKNFKKINSSNNDVYDFKEIITYLLSENGLNYGNLPKGLLKFHKYENEVRTPVEEHFVEGAEYGATNNTVRLHFTVSPEHKNGFLAHIQEIKPKYEKIYGLKFDVSFSEQKSSTDTIAVDLDNKPFRNNDNSLLFRPAGHGALIENLNDLDADIVFVKNIDNVVPLRMTSITTTYKKALAGVLLQYQEKIFNFLKLLDKEQYNVSREVLDQIGEFLQTDLCVLPADNFVPKTKAEQIVYLRQKLDRPIRLCGMVKNEGEPGGGPFWATAPDNTVSLQIVETSQIDMKDSEKAKIVKDSTHFNPVDLICGLKNYKGEKFQLLKFTDPQTGFISIKSKDGKDLKALELPGLWNGAMSDWNTIFVEVPIETFNPVKNINDLLRKEHIA